MPIEFAPPSPQLQGFQITPPQYTDPLQTLAQMGQLRTQGLQQQTAQMGLQKQRMELDSNKALLKAMTDAGTQGTADEIFQRTYNNAAQSGQVLPEHLIALGEHHTKMLQDAAALEKTKLENQGTNIDRLRGLYEGVTDDQGLADAHARADQLGVPANIPRYPGAFDAGHLQAFSNGLGLHSQIIKESQEKAATAASQATEAKEKILATEGQQKVDAGENAAVIRELQQAPVDPATSTPTPAAVKDIQTRHPKVILPPDISTKAGFDRFVRSGVPGEKQPEYDINTLKAALGVMGNSEFDQYQLRYAQSIGKKPKDLNFADMQTVTRQYATDHQSPEMLAILAGLRGAQTSMAKAQVAALPSDAELDAEAKDYRNLDMSPSRIAAMREGRISYFPQILQKAREQAAAEGQPFSPATLEAKYDTWLNTEKNFASGGQEAALLRGFENLMRHTALGYKAKDALSQNDYPAMKRIANTLGVAAGKDAGTTYDLIASFIADEAAKAFLPGGGGESERAQKLSHLDRGLGTTQLSSNYKGLMELADSQRQTLEREYAEGTFGKGPRIGRLFSPDALASRDLVLGKKPSGAPGGPRTGRIIVKAGDNSLHPFDSEAQAKAFEDAVKKAGGTTSRQ